MSSHGPPKRPPTPEVHQPGFSFDDEATVAMRDAVFEEDPTDPFVDVPEGVADQWSMSTSDAPAAGSMSAGELRSVLAEVERIKGLAGSRSARITPEIFQALALGLSQGGGLLLAPQAVAATEGLLAVTEDQYHRAVWLLRQAGRDEAGEPITGADADAERALLLRAVAERRSDLETGAFSQLLRRLGIRVGSDRKLSEIIAFASEIRGRAGIRSSSGQG